jgi:STE24 endopeptidase
LQFWVILLFAVMLVTNSLGSGGVFALTPGQATVLSLAPTFALAAVTHLAVLLARRSMDRGSLGAITAADRIIAAARFAAVGLHAANVLLFGWLAVVRGVVGDLVLVDEILAVTPAVLVITSTWWSFYPIDRGLREHVQIRQLERGAPVYPIPSRAVYVWSNVRHSLLGTAVPMLLLLAWIESFERVLGWADGAPLDWQWLARPAVRQWVATGGQLVGVAAVFLLGPLLMRLVWDTTPLGAGPVRDRLLAMCGQTRVGVRDLLVWRTNGSMVNGAVMGLVGPVRYVLLTDALLDSLPDDEVEAVMAHELAHVRHHHMPWLACVLFAGFSAASVIAGWFAPLIERLPDRQFVAAEVLLAVGTLGAVLILFGYASRRFEWQADAFAAQHLSAPGHTITEPAVAAMAGALESVARLNHIPRDKFTWRHGSIADRQRRLDRLVGQPIDGLPIDRAVRRIKRTALAVLLASIIIGMFQPW